MVSFEQACVRRTPFAIAFTGCLVGSLAACAGAARAQAQALAAPQEMPTVQVSAERSAADRNQAPNTTQGITAAGIADTINATGIEDTLKYLPSIQVRKRFAGDTQAPMATRTTGINASARSLIYVDGLLLSTLVNNNNANGSPQWFMVTPEEVQRIDVLYGPFSAVYPGNSYGAVTEITTHMPTRFEGSAKITATSEAFSHYGTRDTYRSGQAAAAVGNRNGDWSWRIDASHLTSNTQPVTYLTLNRSATAAGPAAPVIGGAIADRNRTGGDILVVGAGNLTHVVQDTAKLKVAYAIDPTLTATYTLGYWRNQADAHSVSYLGGGAAGSAGYAGGTGPVNIGGRAYDAATIATLFSSNRMEQEHWIQNLSLKSKSAGPWRWEVAFSDVDFAKDLTRTSTGPYPAAQGGGPGRIADAGGTGWRTFDARAMLRPHDAMPHSISAGMHVDRYVLQNPTYRTTDWTGGGTGGPLVADARGKTRTAALWAQDVWTLSPSVSATLGLRYEDWRASDGFNLAVAANGTAFPVVQPSVRHDGFSPKASVAWQLDPAWSVTGSFGRALRFPTVGELYQNVQTGVSFTRADPFLRPEKVSSGELAIERVRSGGRIRMSLFQENVSDALIGQTSTLPGVAVPVSFVQNVERTRQRGIELVLEQKDAMLHGLDLNGSITWTDGRILANRSYVATIPGATSVGRRTPYIPEWRATAVASYRPDDRWVWTLAGRASTRLYATVDNTDVNPATYQGFEGFFVMDARVRYRVARQWSAALGIDNLNNRDYFLFHSFPQRTVVAELKFDY